MPVPTVKTRFSGRNKADVEREKAEAKAAAAAAATAASKPNSNLPRPTLLGGTGSQQQQLPNISSTALEENIMFPPRPRRLWKVSDTRLNALPAGYPPIDPRCSIYVADAPPSVVAVRIAEALRRLNVAVEYDEETPCATCWTVDRCHFVIQLWQGPKNQFSVRTSHIPDLSGGILVEGMRLSGSVITYHRLIKIILAASISHDTGEDRRSVQQCNPLEFPRWVRSNEGDYTTATTTDYLQSFPSSSSDPVDVTKVLTALEEAVSLLEKDRHDAQVLGMERLVHLTDVHSVGVATAALSAQSLLGVPPVEEPSALLLSMHKEWMMGLLVDRKLPTEKDTPHNYSATVQEIVEEPKTPPSPSPRGVGRLACVPKLSGASNNKTTAAANAKESETTTMNDEDNESARVEALLQEMREERAITGDANHAGQLRGLLMRIWANCLQVLNKYDRVALTALLQHKPDITSRNVVDVLLEDVEGCSRPPLAAVMGTRLASPHESVWALVCLRILAQHSTVTRKLLEQSNKYAAALEKAVTVGSSVHCILEQEAKLSQSVWSQ